MFLLISLLYASYLPPISIGTSSESHRNLIGTSSESHRNFALFSPIDNPDFQHFSLILQLQKNAPLQEKCVFLIKIFTFPFSVFSFQFSLFPRLIRTFLQFVPVPSPIYFYKNSYPVTYELYR